MKRKKEAAGEAEVERVSSNDFDFDIGLHINRLKIRKAQATAVHGNVNYIDDIITLRSLKFNSCGGSLSASGYLMNYSKAKMLVELRNVNITQLFEQCENFKQKALQSHNVSGKLSATTSILITFGDHFTPVPASLAADVKASLKDGHLIDYEPLQKISNYIFKKRNFKDVVFTEILPVFRIRGSEMRIEDMEVASSLINFFLSGTYDFKKESNLNLLVPWSNLRTRGKDYVPKKTFAEGESVKGLKLNVYGYPDKMKIRLGNKESLAEKYD